MAGKLLTDAEKSDLKKRGLWGAFLAGRESYSKGGLSRAAAERTAYDECIAGDAGDKLPSAPTALAGKQASEVEIIRWVARNIDNPDANAEDCPDPFAWTLLRSCRGDPGFVGWFTEKLWVKLIPAKAQLLDPADDGPIDGATTMDLIVRIQGVRERAREVAGSSLAPATSPEASV